MLGRNLCLTCITTSCIYQLHTCMRVRRIAVYTYMVYVYFCSDALCMWDFWIGSVGLSYVAVKPLVHMVS